MRRRSFLAGAAALPLAAAAPVLADEPAEPAGDAGVITRLHRHEMFALAVYRRAVRIAPARVRAAVAPLRTHEFKQVAALATSLEALGADRTLPPVTDAELAREARALRLQGDWRRPAAGDLLELETALLRAWIEATAPLRDEQLVRLAGQVLAAKAQHLVVLRGLLGREEVPVPVEPAG